jgi:Tol biopolymer transport system component
MTTPKRLERDLPTFLRDLAAAPYPDYIDDVLATTAQRRQRPTWTFPERWLPVDITTTQVPVARPPWRALGILALIGILIACALAVYVGSQPTTPPAPPFGLAVNGQIAYAQDGDIFAVDPATGDVMDLVVGPRTDSDPTFSPDGRRVAFVRAFDDTKSHVLVASTDGSGQTVVTPEPLRLPRNVAFSPSGDRVLIEAENALVPSLAVVGVDGSDFQWLDTAGPASRASFLPPTGSDLLFVSGRGGPNGEAIKRLELASGEITTLVEAVEQSEIIGAPSASPDGARFAYSLWVKGGPAASDARNFTMPSDGSAPTVLLEPAASICCEGLPTWSNDGTRLAVNRLYDDYGVIAIVPADGGGMGTEVRLEGSDLASMRWSPDDQFLLGARIRGDADLPYEHFVIDVEAAAFVPQPWGTQGAASWQRRAP